MRERSTPLRVDVTIVAAIVAERDHDATDNHNCRPLRPHAVRLLHVPLAAEVAKPRQMVRSRDRRAAVCGSTALPERHPLPPATPSVFS